MIKVVARHFSTRNGSKKESMALKFKRFNKIIAFEKQLEQEEASVGYVAYHSENMEVASISKDIFGELSLPQTESFREEIGRASAPPW